MSARPLRRHRRGAVIAAALAATLLWAPADGGAQTKSLAPEPRVVAGDALLQLEISGIRHSQQSGRHVYTHDRIFSHVQGVGVTMSKGQVCFSAENYCVEAEVSYRVPPGQPLVMPGHHVATERARERITITYWGRDDIGNEVSVARTLAVEGAAASVEVVQVP